MSVVFLGGSRGIARLPAAAVGRIDRMMVAAHVIVIGDAAGADAAMQAHLAAAGYRAVRVFCSGRGCRHNAGGWPVERVAPPPGARGFAVHAAKDRAMALAAEFGLMVWDGQSPGTMLNLLRLLRAGKIGVLIGPEGQTRTLKSLAQWEDVLGETTPSVRAALRARASPEEWGEMAPLPGLSVPAV